jgi:hypothetical protein
MLGHAVSRSSLLLLPWAAGLFVGFVLLSLTADANGQNPPPANRTVVNIRGARYGGTPLSYLIEAEADYLQAYGQMHESLAVARKIHAEAYSLELDNWVKYVKCYWERRRLYEAEYRRLHPLEWDVEKERQARMTQLVNEQYQRVLRGDTTRVCNWILRELANSVVSYQCVSGRSPNQPETDCQLMDQDLRFILLTDGGRGGKPLVFAANEKSPLLPPWPFLLLAPDFDKAREHYEQVQKAVVEEIKTTHKFSHENHTDLIAAIEKLYAALEVAYPKENREGKTKVYADYRVAKQAVDMLAANVHRAATLNDASVIDGQLCFKGNSLFALVQHMYKNGLEFAPRKPGTGGELTYQKLFTGLRQIYVRIGPDDRAAAGQPPKAMEAKQGPDNLEPPAKHDDPKDDRAT